MSIPENETLLVTSSPSPHHRFVWDKQGNRLDIPEGWACLKPGDAAVTRTLKSLGPSWTATRKKGRKTFSDGVWAPTENIEAARRIVSEKTLRARLCQKAGSGKAQTGKEAGGL